MPVPGMRGSHATIEFPTAVRELAIRAKLAPPCYVPRGMKALCLLALVALPAAPVAASDTRPKKRPEPAKSCATWQGRVRGNDPDVAIKATLCETKGRVHGTIVWTGRSGSSTRTVSGAWSTNTLTLRDDKLTGTPSPGWRSARSSATR